jgi:hypothetical protein
MQDRGETPHQWRKSHAVEMRDSETPTRYGTEADAPEAVRQVKRQIAKAQGRRGGLAKRNARKRGAR